MAELADAADLESVVSRRVGSSPTRRTWCPQVHVGARFRIQARLRGASFMSLLHITAMGALAVHESARAPVQIRSEARNATYYGGLLLTSPVRDGRGE